MFEECEHQSCGGGDAGGDWWEREAAWFFEDVESLFERLVESVDADRFGAASELGLVDLGEDPVAGRVRDNLERPPQPLSFGFAEVVAAVEELALLDQDAERIPVDRVEFNLAA